MTTAPARLLVGDEEDIPGGLEALRATLMPALARQLERLVWVLPDQVAARWRQRGGVADNVQLTGLWPESGTAARIFWRLHGSWGARLPASGGTKWAAALRSRRYRMLARSQRLGHFLTTCAFTQAVPRPGCPVSAIVCDVSPSLAPETLDNIRRWIERADHIACISAFTRDELCIGQPQHRQKMQVLPLAGPTVEPSAQNLAVPDPVSFYYPATANPRKDHLTLFRACLQLVRRGFKFRCVLSGAETDQFSGMQAMRWLGNEPARRFLVDNAAELAGCIECRGQLPSAEQARTFAGVGCVVLPTQYEGFGLPLAEALAWGRPVICTPLPPFLEQVELYRARERVMTFPVGDDGALAQRMAEQLRTPRPIEAGVEAGRRMAIWTWEDVARNLREAMAGAIMPGPTTRSP